MAKRLVIEPDVEGVDWWSKEDWEDLLHDVTAFIHQRHIHREFFDIRIENGETNHN